MNAPGRAFIACILLLTVTGITGCLAPALPPPSTFDLKGLDTSPLLDKVIVLDPGHGGPERGAIGKRGLQEAEVNLGVALHLWGLLKEAGARPLLTRKADASIYRENEFDLKKDLDARSRFSNKNNADLFISIHHNASGKNKKANNLLMFYKLTDHGVSRDIARETGDALNEALAPPDARVYPGNYHVLRNTAAPAILGEASFMTHPKNELRLAYHRTLMREAQGYFLGILRYFSKGVPEITALAPRNAVVHTAQPKITANLSPGRAAAIDQSTILSTLNGKKTARHVFDNDTFSYVPENLLPNGAHTFCISARNTAGNISKTACATFTVSLPPATASLVPVFPVVPADAMSGTPLDITVQDRLGRPVIDETLVHISATGGTVLTPVVKTRNGRARAKLISAANNQKIVVTARAGKTTAQCPVRFGTPQDALFMATVRDTCGNPVYGASLVRNHQEVDLSDTNGFLYDSVPSDENISYTLCKKGYHPLSFQPELSPGKLTVKNMLLRPVDEGVFFGRTIMLDAAGDTPECLPLLLELKKRIDSAGGTALLTWQKPPAPTQRRRVIMAGRADADIFLTIEYHRRNFSAGYYYKSKQGLKLATLIRESFKGLGVLRKECNPEPSTRYVIIHTAMPALWLTLPEKAHDALPRVADGIYGSLAELFRHNGLPEPQ